MGVMDAQEGGYINGSEEEAEDSHLAWEVEALEHRRSEHIASLEWQYWQLICLMKRSEAEAARVRQARPKASASKPAKFAAQSVPDEKKTTLMLKNLPNDYTRDFVVDLLNEQGLKGKYDFVYVPRDFKRKSGLGYAFVNMRSHEDAVEATERLHGFRKWRFRSQKELQVLWGEHQGYQYYINRYRNSPVMHNQVLEENKPKLFTNDGTSFDLPIPTKTIKPPRAKARTKVL